MEENLSDDINKKLENLSKRCDILEKENIDYKKMIKLNQDNILNLLTQLKYLRNEYKKEINIQINKLKENLLEQIDNTYQRVPENKNEIIIENENENNNNNLFDIKKLKDKIKFEINNMVQEQLGNFKCDIYFYVRDNIQEEKADKQDENNNNTNEDIKIRFEKKLNKIMLDKKQEIPDKDIKYLKKLGTGLLIKHKESPLDVSKVFLETNFNDSKEKNEIYKIDNNVKKGKILLAMDDIVDLKLDINNQTKYLKDFREKYGIDDNEISDKEITKYMKKFNNDETKTIEAILKKLKYIK